MHVCPCTLDKNEEEESMREREVQPSFSPLGTTGNSSMSFLLAPDRWVCVDVWRFVDGFWLWELYV
jgi:hypothetical protein